MLATDLVWCLGCGLQLYGINRDLIMEHTKRATNHTDLLAALKQVPPPSLSTHRRERAGTHHACAGLNRRVERREHQRGAAHA